MLTRQGAAVTTASVALIVAGRLFGIFELFVLGAGGASLVVAAIVLVGLTRVHLDVGRELRPNRVHARQPATVRLRIHNRGARRTPVLALRDVVQGIDRAASVVLAPLAVDQTVTATYALPCERRGVLAVGPMEVRVSDPFGLASVSSAAAPVSELLVWPAVEAVLPLPLGPGDDRDTDGRPSGALAVHGEDLYALRPYVDGDDRRLVHWRASAHHDDLVVRQHERPAPGRATVVLDAHVGSYEGETFERAVSAAASVALACARVGRHFRVMSTTGYDSGFGADRRHLDAVMEHLAVVQLRDLGHLPTLLGSLLRPGRGRVGSVAVLTGARPGNAGWVDGRDPSGAPVTVVAFTTGRRGAPEHRARPGTVVVDDATSFEAAWNQALVSPPGLATSGARSR